MVAYKDDDHVQLVSRNGVDHTWRFADVAAAIAKLCARTLAIDGEVAIYDQQLRSRFDWLRDPDPNAVASPPLLMAFDLLYHDGRDLTRRPLRNRRTRLEDVVAVSGLVVPVRRLAADGLGGVEAGRRARLRELRREGRGELVRARPDAPLAQGEATGLDGRRGSVAAADQHWCPTMTLLADLLDLLRAAWLN